MKPREITRQIWLIFAYFCGAIILIEYVAIILLSLWVCPFDILIPVKFAFVSGYILLIMQTASRIRPLFDREEEARERQEAFFFLPLTLIAVVAVLATLPELFEFLFSMSMPFQVAASLSLYAKGIVSVGMLVILIVPVSFLKMIEPGAIDVMIVRRYGLSKRSWEVMQQALRRKGE